MNSKVISIFVALGMIYGLISQSDSVKAQETVQFICSLGLAQPTNESIPTTYAWTSRGKIAVLRWETTEFKNYPPQKRCEEVSPRFQEAYDNGSLSLITNGKMNGQSVICTSREVGDVCDTLLITLRPKDNSLEILTQLQELLSGRQVGAVRHSSGTPQIYYQVDIENFLRTAPLENQ